MSMIPLSKPDITNVEIDQVVSVLRSGRLSIGPVQVEFEDLVARRSERTHGIAVNSGTSGLHLVLLALGIGPGDEVITTPFSFVASANCILYVGAKPVFVDIDPVSLNLNPELVEKAITEKTKAIIGVEVFGNPEHMDKIAQIAGAHEIPLIEDACEALGGVYKKKAVGSFGRAAVFGFYPNKQITTGEGGMIVTDDDRLAALCRSMRNQGRADMSEVTQAGYGNVSGSFLAHARLGYNYRMSEMTAALGVAQMGRLDEFLEKRRRIVHMYHRYMMDWEDILLPNVPEECGDTMSWFVFVIRLNDTYTSVERDRIIRGMHTHEIGASNYFPCIHLQPFYQNDHGYREGTFCVAESVSQRTIALPFYPGLDEVQVEQICHTLKLMIDRERYLRKQ